MPVLRRRYGETVRLRLAGGRTAVQLSNPEHIRQMLAGSPTTFHPNRGNAVLLALLGENSLFLADEDEHVRLRRLLTPAFNGAALRGYGELITGLAVEEAERWPSAVPFSAHTRMQALTLEVMLRVVYGIADGPRLNELRSRLPELFDIGPLDLPGLQIPKLQRYWVWRRKAELHERVDELIRTETAERRSAPDLAGRTDVLSQLLRFSEEDDGGGLSDAELHDNLITMLVAGHETTATALAWALYELSHDPGQLALAQRAADENDQRYLEAVVKESLRLHPVIHEVGRVITEPVDLGGYRLPAGTLVMGSIGLVHADPSLFERPTVFRPSRFLDDNPPPTIWLPFGGGLRRCIGAAFSLTEGTIVLREVLRRWQLEPDGDRTERTRVRNLMLVPARGARISGVPRT
ncbi:cytochrome P450 [Cryptosporangium japonicum]|uniref:Cytochrome P450 n=2 Tax=Cryptosporangium japonicum TaxID=80872 RepID=A0ABP3D4W8_9ACTN